MPRNKIEEILNKELQKKVIVVEEITNEIMDHLGQKFQVAYTHMGMYEAGNKKRTPEQILKELYEKIRGDWRP